MNIIDGYYHNKKFIETDPLPIIHIGDMVYFKYGRRDEKTRIAGVNHYFYEDDDGNVRHWMSVVYKTSKGKSKPVQGNWVIKE